MLFNEYSFEIVGRLLKKIVKYPSLPYISNFIAAISSGSHKSYPVFPQKTTRVQSLENKRLLFNVSRIGGGFTF